MYKPDGSTMVCAECGATTMRRGTVQKYCPKCSEARDLLRKQKWAKENPAVYDPARRKARMKERRAVLDVIRQQVAAECRSDIAWMAGEVNLAWIIRIAVPFHYALSKNHIYTTTRKGHIFLREDQKTMRLVIHNAFRAALGDRRIAHNKVWLDILVQKSDHRGDAVNVIDGICDALKKAIGIDDRWFCIRRLDWEIIKDKPMIYIGIGQESDEDVQPCANCGQIKPFTDYNKNRCAKNGIARECRDCAKAADRIKREQRKQKQEAQ